MKHNTFALTATILSMSLLTVMAGAAIAPALNIIQEHFSSASPMLIRLIVSMPALLIILTNFLFLPISRHVGSRTIALWGLALYVGAGAGCFFVHHIGTLLALRALLGVSVGLVMPLSTGLLAYYYPPEEQARLMGLSAAMNQMGGVVATMLAGILANVQWNYAFLVYLLGLIAMVLVALFLPNERLGSANKRGVPFQPRQLLKFHPSVVGMFLVMLIFFVYPTNFAVISAQTSGLSVGWITLIMCALDAVAFAVGLVFGGMMHALRRPMKYLAPLFFLGGYAILVGSHTTLAALVGSCLIGLANGIGVPYLNTIASIKGGRNSATTVMPLLSMALYLGQFLSPIIVGPLATTLFGADDATSPYKVAIILSLIYLLQTYTTRHFQSLPPSD